MTTQMSRQPREPCSLCCGIISYITNGLAEESAEIVINQPPWHTTTQEIRESSRDCILCETIWQAVFLPRLKEVTHDYPGAAALLVSLKFGSHRKANGVHWANVYTNLTAGREKFRIVRVDSIGISLQPQDVAKDKLRLVHLGDEPPTELRYATLSHCWGGKLPIFTSRATRKDFEKSIPEDSLPQTFRDAVQIARSLDIPYLWIDALCIVQDDIDEWQREAAKMQHIYSGSFLTIAACESKDSTEGCFTNNSSLSRPPIDCLLQSPREEHGIHHSRNADSSYRSPEEAYVISLGIPGWSSKVMVRVQPGTPWSTQRTQHLSTRGWVLQEQLLSNRIVHCMRSDVHWQCRHIYKTQAGQIIDNETLLEDGDSFFYSPSKRQDRTWCNWMEDYSTRNFSITGDRIPALTGIMDHYGTITGDSHLLGLWKKTFTRDLLWIRVGDIKGDPCANTPSWTWLSCYAPIEIDPFTLTDFDENPKEDHIVLLESEVIWSGPPMTSKIQSTRLVISGPLQMLRFRVDPKSKAKFNPPYLHLEGEDLDESDPTPWTCIGQFDAGEPFPGKYVEYLCLLVRTRKHSDQGRFKEAFLILDPVGDPSCQDNEDQPPTFRRIGIGCRRGAARTFISAKRGLIRLC
ncbi:unnamed protein product [Clonostachys byssicola]|uniref:Heterokaryon incompatibility domain-containing protein n=1 Tax=Clonostachys byssicola TaxID=160290 RepID=A0A9N9XVT1_9HYPO|nr:unnamed protein product [Clonostachys byssicola]